MKLQDQLQREFTGLHRLWDAALEGMNDETFNWRPNEERSLSAAFSAWHYVRTEDNIINFVLQRKPTVWIEKGYDVRFGLDSKAQGTGMPLEDAQAQRIEPLSDWKAYTHDVWNKTDEFVKTLDDDALQGKTVVKPLGEMTVLDAISNMCVSHGFRHLGEVEYIRGMLGLGSAAGI
ncbi:MAG TPA: DinB family protein [Dehalococcoidia bacterium]|nr:DinB family protein [Dehalococcoidia bacterium]